VLTGQLRLENDLVEDLHDRDGRQRHRQLRHLARFGPRTEERRADRDRSGSGIGFLEIVFKKY
jgi:hypothetical protein